eukprot:COSAG04_NODE_21038_length_381_cov_0.897163_1_plen_51_part_10
MLRVRVGVIGNLRQNRAQSTQPVELNRLRSGSSLSRASTAQRPATLATAHQ